MVVMVRQEIESEEERELRTFLTHEIDFYKTQVEEVEGHTGFETRAASMYGFISIGTL